MANHERGESSSCHSTSCFCYSPRHKTRRKYGQPTESIGFVSNNGAGMLSPAAATAYVVRRTCALNVYIQQQQWRQSLQCARPQRVLRLRMHSEHQASGKPLGENVSQRPTVPAKHRSRPHHSLYDIANAMQDLPELGVWAKRVVVIFSDYLSDLIVLDMIDRIDSLNDVIAVTVGILLAYTLADLSSGIMYTFVDTMPEWRRKPGAHHLHHQHHELDKLDEYALWKSDFFDRCWWACLWVTPFLSVVAGWQPMNLGFEALCVMYLSFLAILPQLKVWATMEKPPAPVKVLQDFGILYRAKPGDTNAVCFVNGWWNPLFNSSFLVPSMAKFDSMSFSEPLPIQVESNHLLDSTVVPTKESSLESIPTPTVSASVSRSL